MSLTPVTHSLADLARPLATLAAMYLAEPSDNQIAYLRNPDLTSRWPLSGPIFQRGAALVVESALARETREKICSDYHRQLAPEIKLSAQPLARQHLDLTLDELVTTFSSHDALIDTNLPADHLGVILSAIATLAGGNRDRVARAWSHQYLGTWAAEACEQMALRSATMFYQGVFTLTAALIEDLISETR
ncbi:hypothetical protein BSZ39_08780 [Bowdeniella nasicola]|uniref:Chaperone TorD involved in molybdoenzyme TorA maturation n=1 Tax=Bowdeniella nasicola TaxID=208480 RepID=A0A1Q5Q1L6_9ACTO|nr:hypothetical protein [Bowdeniella nasicola]OKL53582.1 hypothetical protein BSZ39_08780 [Bowdeniella nasicola]